MTTTTTIAEFELGVQHWHAGTTPTQGVHMATYITLLKYTERGLKTIKERPRWLEKAKHLLTSLGGELPSAACSLLLLLACGGSVTQGNDRASGAAASNP